MTSRSLAYFLFPFLLCSLSFYSSIAQSTAVRRIDGTSIDTAMLTKYIRNTMDSADVAGLGIAVFNDNQPVYIRSFGYADRPKNIPFSDTAHLYGASFSKAVFTYLVMQLVGEGVIDLDRPLVKYLPEPLLSYTFPGKLKDYRDLEGDKRYEKITARMCLDHTTGFPNFRWFEPDRKLRIKFEPGTRVSYSGEGMYLLQVVIQEILHTDLETLARQRVFGPLHMNNTSYEWQPRFDSSLVLGHDSAGKTLAFPRRPNANAAGSMITTLKDYISFYTAVLQGRGLKPAEWNEMTSAQIRIRSIQQFGPLSWKDSTTQEKIQLAYGLGFGVFQTAYGRAFFKEGHDEGWGHYSVAFPDKKTAVVIMTNSDNGESAFRDLLSFTIGDIYTPWYWENYIPWEARRPGHQSNVRLFTQ